MYIEVHDPYDLVSLTSPRPVLSELVVKMYFPLVFEVISRACFPLTPAAPFIVSSMLLLVSF